MMGERAFHPLKAAGELPESSKQAEMALAWLQTILSIGRPASFREGNRWVPQAGLQHPFGLNCR
jgi:hypothetical protein